MTNLVNKLHNIYKIYRDVGGQQREVVAFNLDSAECHLWFRKYDEFKGLSNPLNKSRGFFYTCGESWSSNKPGGLHTDFPITLTITAA